MQTANQRKSGKSASDIKISMMRGVLAGKKRPISLIKTLQHAYGDQTLDMNVVRQLVIRFSNDNNKTYNKLPSEWPRTSVKTRKEKLYLFGGKKCGPRYQRGVWYIRASTQITHNFEGYCFNLEIYWQRYNLAAVWLKCV